MFSPSHARVTVESENASHSSGLEYPEDVQPGLAPDLAVVSFDERSVLREADNVPLVGIAIRGNHHDRHSHLCLDCRCGLFH